MSVLLTKDIRYRLWWRMQCWPSHVILTCRSSLCCKWPARRRRWAWRTRSCRRPRSLQWSTNQSWRRSPWNTQQYVKGSIRQEHPVYVLSTIFVGIMLPFFRYSFELNYYCNPFHYFHCLKKKVLAFTWVLWNKNHLNSKFGVPQGCVLGPLHFSFY